MDSFSVCAQRGDNSAADLSELASGAGGHALGAAEERRILVTGGAGYIGSHTCKALAAAGYSPVVLDNLSTGHRWAVRWGPFIEGDLENRRLLSGIMSCYNIRAVMHFAASAYVGESMQDPGKYFRNNAAHTINLLEAMVETGVESIVFSSSCATYGLPQQLPIPETHPQHPINPYGESKRFVEKMLHWYGKAYGLRSYVLRYFNAAGDDPEGETGEMHYPETHLIPLVIETALSLRRELSIYGTDYETPDGTAVRDYVHVMDLARAHVAALNRLQEGDESRCLNLGTGIGRSVREIVKAVERISGLPVETVERPRRPGDPPILVAAPGAAATILDWQPCCSDLDSIISSALVWHANQNLPAGAAEVHGEETCRHPVMS